MKKLLIVVLLLGGLYYGYQEQQVIDFLKLSSGRTVLIAHNIDLAPRVRSISTGDTVSFYGQFDADSIGVNDSD